MEARTRIGLIIPSTNGTAEPDFNAVAPNGVTIHTHRMWNGGDKSAQERLERMNTDVEQAAFYLSTARVNLIAYACTTGSLYKGSEDDQDLLEIIQRAANVPAIATASAVAEALRFVGTGEISVATPYGEWENQLLGLYYQAMGFQVLNVTGDPMSAGCTAQAICDLSPETVLEFAPKVCRAEADALFCACTAWRSMEVVAELESITGKPVVTANQATIWAALKHLGITNPRPGFGSVIDSLAVAIV